MTASTRVRRPRSDWSTPRLVSATAIVALGVGGTYVLWPTLVPGAGDEATVAFGLVTEALAALVAAGLLWWGSSAAEGSARTAWRLVAAGMAAWASGSLVWLAYALAGGEPTWPGPVDLLYLSMVPLVGAGLALHPTPRRRDRFLRSLVDGMLVAFSLLLVAWVGGLRFALEDGTEASNVVNLLYPLSDTLLVVMALGVCLLVAPSARAPVALLTTGLVLVTVSDLTYFVTVATGSYDDSPLWMDAGWAAGFTVVAGAGLLLARGSATAGNNESRAEELFGMLPSWLAGAALIVGIVELSLDRNRVGYTLPLVMIVTGLLLARQGLAVMQQRRLADRLARSVRRLATEATHDRLTGLPNRNGLTERLASQRSARRGVMAVAFVDIDHLKTVNDSLGHEVGDQLICEMAHRLGSALGRSEVTRFGGDEFVAALVAADRPGVLAAAKEIVALGSEPATSSSLPVSPSVSAGLAVWEPGLGVDEVLRRADTALYAAKRQGRRRVVVYDPMLDAATRRRVELEPELRRAVGSRQLSVHYQPIHDLASGRLVGAEALVRWHHPQLGLVNPDDFLPHARDAGLMESIGGFVLDTAVADFAGLNARHPDADLGVSVNMSAGELGAADTIRRVQQALSGHGLEPSRLTVEVTEDVVVDATTRRTIDRLRLLGVGISIDDFGTGNSSLRQLGSYPAGTLKVDRTFVDGLGRDDGDSFVVRAILNLARALGMATVAEGVEDHRQLEELRLLGCDAAQGWLFGRAMPFEELARLIDGRGQPAQRRASTVVASTSMEPSRSATVGRSSMEPTT